MKVRDVMTADPKYIEVPSTRQIGLMLFQKYGVSGMPVLKEGTRNLVGFVTLNDFARNPDEEQVAMIMQRDFPTVGPDDDLSTACEVMLNREVRHLPVVFEGMLAGIVTVKDILARAVLQLEIDTTVSDVFVGRVTALWDGTPLPAAYSIMEASKSRTCPVLDSEGNVVGVISDMDILRSAEIKETTTTDMLTTETEGDQWSLEGKNLLYVVSKNMVFPEDKKVGDLMGKEVSVSRRTPVKRCARIMIEKNLREIPVISPEGKLLGTLRDIDILKALLTG